MPDTSCPEATHVLLSPCPPNPPFAYVAFPKGKNVDRFVGRLVEVRGTIDTAATCSLPLVQATRIGDDPATGGHRPPACIRTSPDQYLRIVIRRPRPLLSAALIGLAVLLLAAPPASAIQVPQTREEFVRAVAAGARGAKMETLVVERGFDEVYRTLEARTAPCLDVEVRRTAYVGYWENSSSDYNPTLRKLGPDRAEFTLQVVHRPRGVGHTPPPGGLYVMAADLKRAGASRTEVLLYRPSIGFKNIAKSFMQWAEGRGTDCPKLK